MLYCAAMSDEYFVIVNLLAGRGRCRRLWPRIEARLKQKQMRFHAVLTEAPGTATEIARRASRDFSIIVAVGGDGTIHEVAGGLIGTKTKLGIIPAGTGNDFVKMLHIPPLDPEPAIEILQAQRSRTVDVGRYQERYFVNGLGVGLDGAVAWRIFRRWNWPGLAHWTYLYAAVYEALFYRSGDVRVRSAEWQHEGKLMMIGASNGRFHGGDFLLAPHAEIDDGLFDVYMISEMSPLRRLQKIPLVRRGEHLGLPEVQIKRASWVEITSERPLLGHLDGEPLEFPAGSFRVELLPKALEVISA